jgi:hypothetical protein
MRNQENDSGLFELVLAIAHSAFPQATGILWFWVGTHAEYDNLIR